MKILYFAQAAQQAGCHEETWDVQVPISQDEFWQEMETRHPGMAALRPICRLARNCDYLDPSGSIQPDDEMALIPPVSGG